MLVAGAESETLKTLGSLGEVLTGVATSLGLIYAARQVRTARSMARTQRTYEYADQLDAIELQPVIAEARDFWRFGRETGVRPAMGRYHRMKTLDRHRIVLPMNMMEEIASQYLQNKLDDEIAHEQFSGAILGYYEEASWFIEAMQEERGPQVFVRWKAMVDALNAPPRPDWLGRNQPWHNGALFR